MNGTCLSCRNLNGCSLLVGPKGDFLSDDIITEENIRICPQWTPVGPEEYAARQQAFEVAGAGAIRGIHRIDELVLEGLTKGGVDAMANLRDLIKEGMTRNDRRDQLLYQTGEDGDFLLDGDGERTPRGSLPLREYAKDPEGPLRESSKKIVGWTAEQLLDAILDAEEKEGLITPNPKTKRTKKEKDMPTILTRKPGTPTETAPASAPAAAPAASQSSKIAKPATGGRRSFLTNPATTAPAAEPELPSKVKDQAPAAAAPQATSGELVEQVAQRVVELLTPVIKEEVEKVSRGIDYTRERNALNLTTLHDLIITTVIDPQRLTNDALLVPAGGNIEEYLEPEGNQGN